MSECKTCKKPIDAGEVRCFEHERAYVKWLTCEAVDRPDVYTPRRDGIGTNVAGPRPRSWRARRMRGLRPGEELNFDEY